MEVITEKMETLSFDAPHEYAPSEARVRDGELVEFSIGRSGRSALLHITSLQFARHVHRCLSELLAHVDGSTDQPASHGEPPAGTTEQSGVEVWVPGIPVPMPRPRLAYNRKTGRPFFPSNTPAVREWKKAIARAVFFQFGRRRARIQRLSFFGAARGDVDNLVKPVLDALEGITWSNDHQVLQIGRGLTVDRQLDRWSGGPGLLLRLVPEDEAAK